MMHKSTTTLTHYSAQVGCAQEIQSVTHCQRVSCPATSTVFTAFGSGRRLLYRCYKSTTADWRLCQL